MTTLQPISINPFESRDPAADTKTIVSPSTPRATSDQLSRTSVARIADEQGARTPTRDSFAAANGKRTLPMSPSIAEDPQEPLESERGELRRGDSHRSTNSQPLQDIDMGGSDEEGEGSENDSNDDQSERPSKKKKKGQRFFCTDYPPCNLSFTRSEHLARHIR
jgi:C2H2 transcription facotor